MKGYYQKKLAAERLLACYEIAPFRVKAYLEAEISFVLQRTSPSQTALELGCGYGRVLKRVTGNGGFAFGIDTSLESLRFGQEFLGGSGHFCLLQMDAVRMGFADRKFDLTFCIQNGICAFAVDREKLFGEALRVTRSGGTVLFCTYSPRFCKDRPMFNRISGFNITEYNVEEFSSYIFYNINGNEVNVEGTKTYIYYECNCEEAPLKIIRNFSNAIKNIGGTAYEPYNNRAYTFIKQGNRETWAEVYAGDYYYYLTIAEKGEVEQEITANAILEELNKTGKAILYINFDSGKSTIKKESMPVVEQIIEVMKQAAEIKISVEGHTDSDGSNESNLKLSEARPPGPRGGPTPPPG